MMELHQITSFVTVARTGNLTRAARLLNTTPPSVSGHIRSLEAEFGVTLFVRTPRGMTITAQGEGLAQKARDILAAIDTFSRAAGAELRGNLFMGINADPDFLRVPDIVNTLYTTHPNLCVEVVSSNTRETLAALETGHLETGRLGTGCLKNGCLDCGFAFGRHDTPGLDFLDLGPVDIAIVVPAAYRSGHRDADWSGIASLPWIIPDTPCPLQDAVYHLLKQQGLSLENRITANDDITKHAFIRQGRGVAVLEKFEAKRFQASGTAFVWKRHEPVRIPLYFAWNEKTAGDPALTALIRVVEKVWNKVTSPDSVSENQGD